MLNADFNCVFETKGEGDTLAKFCGVASTNDLDDQGDVVMAGAFEPIARKSNGSPDVLMLRDHDRTQVIGGWTRISQQGKELCVEGELCLAVEKARETYALLKAGHLSGLSIGFLADKDGVRWDERAGKRLISKGSLKECSVVAFPANRHAKVTLVKSSVVEFLEANCRDEDEPDVLLLMSGLDVALARILKADDPLKPWGDVEYADPGYQDDKVKRYPVDIPRRIRAAWNYIHQARNRAFYTAEQLKRIEGRIIAAWKRKIDPAGPPAYQERSSRVLILGVDDHFPLDLATVTKEARGLVEQMKGFGLP